MDYRAPLGLVALFVLACSPKTDLTESASDTVSSTSSGPGGGSSSIGHSQTSNTPDPTTSGGGQTVTTASPSEPGTISATTGSASDTATDGSISDTATDGSISDTAATTGTTSTTSGTTSTSTTGPCGDPPKQPQDAMCTEDCGCSSNHCFSIPVLGGFCGECIVDADCPDGGCTVPNPVAGVGARCNSGGPGDGCQTDAVCKGPGAAHCAVVIEVPGIITVATCGACETNADCTDPLAPNCSPDYDVGGFTGQLSCKANGSVPNDGGCSLVPENGVPVGNQACASGLCGEANVMGLLKLGVCGECDDNGDCGPGQVCSAPLIDLEQGIITGATCV